MANDRDTTINDIARRFLDVRTLETRGRDMHDFHSLAVWNIKDALERAYETGRASAPPTRCTCPACGREVTITAVKPITPT